MEYYPSLLFRNGHFNTIFASLCRRTDQVAFTRQRLNTPDDDFIDVDVISNQNKRLAILCHGLEGSSSSNYIRGTARHLSENNWDIVAFNFRGCSGEMNRQKIMYHSGATYDLDFVLQNFADDYEEIVIVGFSLGGNLSLKYCGEKSKSIDQRIKAVVGISVPVDLGAGSRHIGNISNYIYEKRFLVSLKNKIKEKHAQFPEAIDLSLLSDAKSLYLFDDLFTAPIHGFLNADDYYSKCSSKKFIPEIKIPGLLLNAIDDPFLPPKCYPFKEMSVNKNMTFLTPRYGGHVGFVNSRSNVYWNEVKTLEFINSCSSF